MENYLKDNLDFLSSVDTTSIDANLLYQLNQLNTKDYNITQRELYAQVNNLYDKLRIMEEVNDYLLTQVKSKIESSSQACEALLKDIEKSRDAIKEVAYHTITIDMTPTKAHYDRDGVLLKAAMFYNNQVINAFSAKRSVPYSLKAETNKRVYHNDVTTLPNGQAYRSYYITDEKYPEGVSEKLHFVFQQPTLINRVATKTSNTNSFNYKLHYQGDNIALDNLSWQEPIYSESASFEVNTANFKEQTYKCDASRISADTLTILENEIYKEYIGQSSYSSLELDTLLGIKALKEDYQKYLQEIAAWQEKRKQVAETNIKNGYTDSVPEHTLVKLPEELGVNDITIDGQIVNEAINTKEILPVKEIITENGGGETHIVYMYNQIENIYPSIERYRFDFLDPSSENYYDK